MDEVANGGLVLFLDSARGAKELAARTNCSVMNTETTAVAPHISLRNNLLDLRIAELVTHALDVLLIPSALALWKGDLAESALWVIIPAALCVARFAARRGTRKVYAELHAHQLVLGTTCIPHAAIQSIHWNAARQPRVSICYHDARKRRAQLLFERLTAADRLILIRYLRRLPDGIEQSGWPSFCRAYAAPLVKRLDPEASPQKQQVGRRSLLERCMEFSSHIDPAAPKWSDYLVLPATVMGVFGVVSRRMYWLTAGLLVASAVINIRLFWDAWLSPFSEIILAFAAVLVALSCFSSAARPAKDAASMGIHVVFWFAVGIIGVPLFGNCVAAGFLPPWCGQFGIHLLFVAIHMPIIVLVIRKRRAELQSRARDEEEALASWNAYEASLAAK